MDIHKPKPWHGMREFLKEYVIIVVGVLTACDTFPNDCVARGTSTSFDGSASYSGQASGLATEAGPARSSSPNASGRRCRRWASRMWIHPSAS